MADVTFEDIRALRRAGQVVSYENWLSAILSLAGEQGFPVTAWAPGEPGYVLASAIAQGLSQFDYDRAVIADGGMVSTAFTKLEQERAGVSQYTEPRKLATFARGKFRLTNAGISGATIQAGARIRTTSGPQLEFVNDVVTVVPAGGTMEIDVTAFTVGAKYNLPVDQPLGLVTAVPGISVSNPAVGTSQTWITSLGTDEEGFEAYASRLPQKWSTLNTGSPKEAYEFWAKSIQGVTRAFADINLGYGQVWIYIDNAAKVTEVKNLIQPMAGYGKAPVGSYVTVLAASVVNVPVTGVVTVKRGYKAEAQALIDAALADLSATTEIGGVLIEAEIVRRVKGARMLTDSTPAVTDFQIGSGWTGTPNLQLAAGTIPLITTTGLTYVETA